MRKPHEAITEILRCVEPSRRVEHVSIHEACGRVLAEPVASDIDLPPFERSAMDGFAVRAEDFVDVDEGRTLTCVGEARAGEPFPGRIAAGQCVAIYTGAEVPADTDTVVMVERTKQTGDEVHIEGTCRAGEHVSHRGEILGVGREVYPAGHRVSAVDLSVLASVGCDPVPVTPRVRVSILTTGDELVTAKETPGPGQIREGNTLYLAAAAKAVGAEVLRVAILPDDPEALRTAFADALEAGDALVTTGGVSAGKYDLVGAALEAIGVRPVLHKVAIKPGKPIWFGMLGAKPVFGLPGNPVSAMLGFEVFVRPALARLAGASAAEQGERLRKARWMGRPPREGDRQQNLPATLTHGDDGVLELRPLGWMGSADIVGLGRAQALAVVPAGTRVETGQFVDYRPLEFLHTAERPVGAADA